MGQIFTQLKYCTAAASPGIDMRELRNGWISFEVERTAGKISPNSSPAISSLSMLANYDGDEDELDVLTEENSSWETTQLDSDNDRADNNDSQQLDKMPEPTTSFNYPSASSKTANKLPAKKRRRSAKKTASTAGVPAESRNLSSRDDCKPTNQIPTISLDVLAGNDVSTVNDGRICRLGTLPSVRESKPMKDADRLLGVLSEHAGIADVTTFDEWQDMSGDAARRLIQHDIGRERSVNSRLRELKDIEGRKSERRLSVTAFPSKSLNVIPEIVGEEPADPDEFQYSEMNLYF